MKRIEKMKRKQNRALAWEQEAVTMTTTIEHGSQTETKISKFGFRAMDL